jgi:hypothetical protein
MKKIDYDNYEVLDDMASDLPYSKERSLLREKAMNIADALQDESKQFDARINYVNDICMEGSFPEKYLTVFPWLLAYAGKSKESYDRLQVLWYYKWVIMIMHEFPSIAKKQIEAALEDLRIKYNEFGSTDKVYHDYSREAYLNLGDYAKSTVHHTKHIEFKRRDKLDDCEACVINRIISYHILTGNIAEALKKARPVFNGKKSCTHVPKDTYTNFITPLLKQKDYALAAEFSEKLEQALKQIKHGGNYKAAYPLMLNHALNNQLSKAIKLFEKYFSNAFDARSMDGKFFFYTAALYLFKRVDKEMIKLKLPKNFSLYNSDSTYKLSALIAWLDKETNTIAALFDKRNENNKYRDEKTAILTIT